MSELRSGLQNRKKLQKLKNSDYFQPGERRIVRRDSATDPIRMPMPVCHDGLRLLGLLPLCGLFKEMPPHSITTTTKRPLWKFQSWQNQLLGGQKALGCPFGLAMPSTNPCAPRYLMASSKRPMFGSVYIKAMLFEKVC